jgi:hypothetical protein
VLVGLGIGELLSRRRRARLASATAHRDERPRPASAALQSK